MTQAGHDLAIKEVKQAPAPEASAAGIHAELHATNKKDQLADARKHHRTHESSPHLTGLPQIDVGDAATNGGAPDKSSHLPNKKPDAKPSLVSDEDVNQNKNISRMILKPHNSLVADEEVMDSKTFAHLKAAASEQSHLSPAQAEAAGKTINKSKGASDRASHNPVHADEDVIDSGTVNKIKGSAPEKQDIKPVPPDEDVQDSASIAKVKAYLKTLSP